MESVTDTDALTKFEKIKASVVVAYDNGEMTFEVTPVYWTNEATGTPMTVGDLVAMAQGVAGLLGPKLSSGYTLERIDVIGTVGASGTRATS